VGKIPTTLVRRRIFLVESFLGIVGPDLPPVRLGEPGEGEYLGAGSVEMTSCRVHPDASEVIDHSPVLRPDRLRVGLGEDSSDHGGHHRLRGAWDLGQQVAQIVGAAPLPRRSGQCHCYCVSETGVVV